MRPKIQYEVNCHPPEGECMELVNASCVVLGVGPLEAIGAHTGDDLEYILKNINSRLSGIESDAVGEYAFSNIGNGAAVWAGLNNRFVGQFRTIKSTRGIEITESTSEILLGVDTDWLHDRVRDVVDEYLAPRSMDYEPMGEPVPTPRAMPMALPEVGNNDGLEDLERLVRSNHSKVNLKINSLENDIRTVDSKVQTYDSQIASLEQEISNKDEDISTLQEQVSQVTKNSLPTIVASNETLESEINTLKLKVGKEWKLKQTNTDETIQGLTQAIEAMYVTIQEQNNVIKRLQNQVQEVRSINIQTKNGKVTFNYASGASIGTIDLCEITDNCISTKPNWVVTGKIGLSSNRDRFVLDVNGQYLYRQVVDINENSASYGQEDWVITTSN